MNTSTAGDLDPSIRRSGGGCFQASIDRSGPRLRPRSPTSAASRGPPRMASSNPSGARQHTAASRPRGRRAGGTLGTCSVVLLPPTGRLSRRSSRRGCPPSPLDRHGVLLCLDTIVILGDWAQAVGDVTWITPALSPSPPRQCLGAEGSPEAWISIELVPNAQAPIVAPLRGKYKTSASQDGRVQHLRGDVLTTW